MTEEETIEQLRRAAPHFPPAQAAIELIEKLKNRPTCAAWVAPNGRIRIWQTGMPIVDSMPEELKALLK